MEKLNVAQQFTATLTTPTINRMLNDDRCFVCGKTGHICNHCHAAQCYNYKDFGHFAQGCPDKTPPLGTPHHHDRSCSQLCYNHHRNRYQSLNYRCNQGKWFDKSRSYCHIPPQLKFQQLLEKCIQCWKILHTIEFWEDVLEFGHGSDGLLGEFVQGSITDDKVFSTVAFRYDDDDENWPAIVTTVYNFHV